MAAGLLVTVGIVLFMYGRTDDQTEVHLERALSNGVAALSNTLEPTSEVFGAIAPLLAQDEFDVEAFQEIAGPVVRQNAFITNVAVFDGDVLVAAVDEERLRTPPPEAGDPVRLSGPPFIGDFITYREADSVVLIFGLRAASSELTMRGELVLPQTYLELMAQAATEKTALIFWLEADTGLYPIVSTVEPIPVDGERISERTVWGTSTLIVEAVSIGDYTTASDRWMPIAVGSVGLLATALAAVVFIGAERRRTRVGELEQETARLDKEIQERLGVERLLAHQATHDELTGLPNRSALMETLTSRLKSNTGPRVGSVMFLDVDRFKEVNDSIGHSAGDSLLQVIAERLQNITSDSTLLTRFGGDEFVIVMDRAINPERFGQRIIAELRPAIEVVGQLVHSTISIGIRTVGEDEQVGALDLIRDADAAMYEAKRSGRDQYFVFNAGVHRRAVDRMAIRVDADRALSSGEFVVHYQPILDLVSDNLVAVETLVRWDHPSRGLLYPDQFLSVLEDTNLVTHLDRHVQLTAAAQLATWRTAGEFRGPLLVNASATSLLSDDFVTSIQHVLVENELDAGVLGIEVTEQTLIADIDRAIEVLARLRELGVVIAIDDFGTGYSSLSYLHRLPFDVLKIDASFVEHLSQDLASRSIVQTLSDLASRLEVQVIAEGVTDEPTKSMLVELGCTLGQGRFLSPVLNGHDFTRWLTNNVVKTV